MPTSRVCELGFTSKEFLFFAELFFSIRSTIRSRYRTRYSIGIAYRAGPEVSSGVLPYFQDTWKTPWNIDSGVVGRDIFSPGIMSFFEIADMGDRGRSREI
eukprot:4408450-Prymnesium_polylepis.1